MTVEKTGDGASQSTGAVTVHDSHLAQTGERSFVEKFVDCINCFIRRLPDHVQLRSSILFRTGDSQFCMRSSFQFFKLAWLRLWRWRSFNQFELIEFFPESQ